MKNDSITHRPIIRGAKVAKTYLISYHPIHDGKIEDVTFTAEIRGAQSADDACVKLRRIMRAYNLYGLVTCIEEKHH